MALLLSRGSAEAQEKRRRRPRGRPRTVEHHLTSSRRLEASRDCTRAMPDASGPMSCAHTARVRTSLVRACIQYSAYRYYSYPGSRLSVVRAQGTAPCASYCTWVPSAFRERGTSRGRREARLIAGPLPWLRADCRLVLTRDNEARSSQPARALASSRSGRRTGTGVARGDKTGFAVRWRSPVGGACPLPGARKDPRHPIPSRVRAAGSRGGTV